MVDYITYKGNKYPIRIAWSTIKKFGDNETQNIETGLWYGLVSGHIADNKELTLKENEVPYILDEVLDEFMLIFNKSMDKFKKDINTDNDKNNKKK
jgi:hypothetical protein